MGSRVTKVAGRTHDLPGEPEGGGSSLVHSRLTGQILKPAAGSQNRPVHESYDGRFVSRECEREDVDGRGSHERKGKD